MKPAGSAAAPPIAHSAARASSVVWKQYGEYMRRPPLITLEWTDSETPARGWLVINSLRGGAAGGGTRMRPGLTRREVTYLAKTMELKFAFSGPPIGGAKSGIDFDPYDPRRAGVLQRWFRAIAPQLHQVYGTGGDLNVDELLDVIPGCAEVGVLHPQEGIVRGHLHPQGDALPRILTALDLGVKAPVGGAFGLGGLSLPVADLVTGYGLARSIIRLYEIQGKEIRGARVLLEGFGAVGGPCGLYLAREGARIVAIADREKVLIERDGIDAREVEALLCAREGKLLPRDDARCLHGLERERLWETPAEIFVSAACSESLTDSLLDRLERQGVRTLACGANQPFQEAKLGATRVQRRADRRFTVIPDVIANCGMARAFSYLMCDDPSPDPAVLFHAVDATITTALHEIVERNRGRGYGLLAATLATALDRLHTP
ncbi:Glu/Leu/Phe/Val dehydrogenase family protein [soil metagenome]